jgi:hypothetical protein
VNLTRWIIVSSIAVIGAIDIVLAIVLGKQRTISVQLTLWSKEYPIIPFAFGLLMGHFFAQNN